MILLSILYDTHNERRIEFHRSNRHVHSPPVFQANSRARAQELVQILTDLGPTFIKIGQAREAPSQHHVFRPIAGTQLMHCLQIGAGAVHPCRPAVSCLPGSFDRASGNKRG